jgi:hypothetical protein
MTNKRKVYTKIMPQTPQNQMITMAMMVAGIVLGRKAQLSAISLEVPHPAKPAGLEKRLPRFVKNERFDVAVNYLPFAELILFHLADKPLVLAIDGSHVGRGCIAIVVGVIYKQRAIPFLISNCSSLTSACDYYRRRFRLETLFSDQKSRGFHIQKSHLSDPTRLSRLLLATSLAYIWLIHLGMMVFQEERKRALIDRTHRSDKSLFRLGLDWVKYSMTHGLGILVAFHLFRQSAHT